MYLPKTGITYRVKCPFGIIVFYCSTFKGFPKSVSIDKQIFANMSVPLLPLHPLGPKENSRHYTCFFGIAVGCTDCILRIPTFQQFNTIHEHPHTRFHIWAY